MCMSLITILGTFDVPFTIAALSPGCNSESLSQFREACGDGKVYDVFFLSIRPNLE